jgi:3-oxoacyl-[acyl-carrier-protein] synthase II
VSSSKGQIGHTLAAAGAIEAAITALVVARQTIVPTAGLVEVDPACAKLTHVVGVGRPARVRAAMTNAFGFGGMDSALVLTEPELGPAHRPVRRAVVVSAAATLTPAGLLGARESAAVFTPAAATELPALDPLLDLERARRLDRPARLGAVVVGRALADAPGLGAPNGAPVGVILGTNFGSIDASAAFMHRVFSKGPRAASPAEFPNLVQSSPVGHVSIYLGLRGPVLAAVELGTTGESAALQAIELIASGEADAIAAGDVQEANGVVERLFVRLFARTEAEGTTKRGEGAGAVVLESEDALRTRGGIALARIAHSATWRWYGPETLPALPPPAEPGAALVVFPRDSSDLAPLLAKTEWASVPTRTCAGSGGEHEALGVISIAAAASLIARGEARTALVIGRARGRGYAVVLVAP